MSAYVYILRSLKNNSYYIGSTTNVKNRLSQHNSGKVFSTKYKKPYDLVFYQQFDNILEAKKVEKIIKRWKRKDFIEKIIEDGRIRIAGR